MANRFKRKQSVTINYFYPIDLGLSRQGISIEIKGGKIKPCQVISSKLSQHRC
jgi:hypothetical protein